MTAALPSDRMKSLNLSGVWWLPSNPEREVYGTLVFNGDGPPKRNCIGLFYEFGEQHGGFQTPIILGLTTTGTPVTLLRCSESESSGSFSSLRTSTIQARFVLVGEHYFTPEEIQFRSFAVSYDHLTEWARMSGLRDHVESDHIGRLRKYTLEYEFPSFPESVVGGMKVLFSPTFHRTGLSVHGTEITQLMFFEVVPEQTITLQALLDVTVKLRNFLSLGVADAVYPVAIEGRPVLEPEPPDKSEYRDRLQRMIEEQRAIEIFYYIPRRDRGFRKVFGADMLFGLWHLGGEFGQCLAAWFAKAEALEPVYDLYFGTVYGSSDYLQTRFLSLAQAVESYHRRTNQRAYLDRQSFRQLRERLCQVLRDPATGLSETLQSIFVNKLAWFNELSLQTRVEEVYDRCGKLAEFLIPDRAKFVRAVKDTRNYLTHYAASLMDRAAHGYALHLLAEQLKFLLELSLLREMGVSEATQEQIVTNHQHYLRIRSQLMRTRKTEQSGASPPESS